jgi:hypothetical protein
MMQLKNVSLYISHFKLCAALSWLATAEAAGFILKADKHQLATGPDPQAVPLQSCMVQVGIYACIVRKQLLWLPFCPTARLAQAHTQVLIICWA